MTFQASKISFSLSCFSDTPTWQSCQCGPPLPIASHSQPSPYSYIPFQGFLPCPSATSLSHCCLFNTLNLFPPLHNSSPLTKKIKKYIYTHTYIHTANACWFCRGSELGKTSKAELRNLPRKTEHTLHFISAKQYFKRVMDALPEMLQWPNSSANGTHISVLQRQRAQMNWQQQSSFSGNDQHDMHSIPQFQSLMNGDSVFGRFGNRAVKPDPGMETEWPGYGKMSGDDPLGLGACGYGNVNAVELNYALSRTISCPPAVAAAAIAEAAGSYTTGEEPGLLGKMSSTIGRESFNKRKADNNDDQKGYFQITEERGTKEKKSKGCTEETDSKITTDQNSNKSSIKHSNCNNKGTSNDTTKENSKNSEVKKPDYIHVRARRGQATDSHSLAERVRREKISERMKYLQDLVPGCNKITGKAGMLDEIINYVQSLQKQVEFLSMKLSTVNPRLDFNADNLFAEKMFPSCTSNFPNIGLLSEVATPAYLQCNPLQQVITCTGLDLETNDATIELKRTTSAPVSIAETFFNPSCFNQLQHSGTWDLELQNLYNAEFEQGRSTNYPSQLFTGSIEGNNLEMEM